MATDTTTALDDVLQGAVVASPGVPGVKQRSSPTKNANIYEGSAGTRELGGDADLTTDTGCTRPPSTT